MKTFKELLIELKAYYTKREWAEEKTIEEFVEGCHRGDWLLWLASNVNISLQPLTLAKGHCANTVRHLMKNEKSINAVDIAIAFGNGEVTIEKLNEAADIAEDYASDVYSAVADDLTKDDPDYDPYINAAFAAWNAASVRCCVDTAAHAANAIYSDNYDAPYIDNYDADANKRNNQQETADICRKYIGDLIIEKVNKLLNTKEE